MPNRTVAKIPAGSERVSCPAFLLPFMEEGFLNLWLVQGKRNVAR
jgi:hypothetical protein